MPATHFFSLPDYIFQDLRPDETGSKCHHCGFLFVETKGLDRQLLRFVHPLYPQKQQQCLKKAATGLSRGTLLGVGLKGYVRVATHYWGHAHGKRL